MSKYVKFGDLAELDKKPSDSRQPSEVRQPSAVKDDKAASRQTTIPTAVTQPSAVKPSDSKTPVGRQDYQTTAAVTQPSAVKERKYKLTARLTQSIAMELKLFCTYQRREVWEVVESAVRDYLNRQTAAVTVDDLDDDRKSDRANFIINLYHELTSNDWKEADWDTYRQVKTMPLEIVEVAMLTAALRAPRPIRSFAYFVSEIQNPDHGKVKATQDYVVYLRSKLIARQTNRST